MYLIIGSAKACALCAFAGVIVIILKTINKIISHYWLCESLCAVCVRWCDCFIFKKLSIKLYLIIGFAKACALCAFAGVIVLSLKNYQKNVSHYWLCEGMCVVCVRWCDCYNFKKPSIKCISLLALRKPVRCVSKIVLLCFFQSALFLTFPALAQFFLKLVSKPKSP